MTDKLSRERITKQEINELPMRQYEGPIHLINTEEAAEAAVLKLKKETLLGFDTETRPAFRKGESYDPSLLQLATADEVFLFQINIIGLTQGLADILADPKIVKSGVAIDRDISELRVLRTFEEGGFVELADVAKTAGIKNLGLRGMTAILFDFRISKREQVSNWARHDLTSSQQTYAATDAWLGRKIFQKFEDLKFV